MSLGFTGGGGGVDLWGQNLRDVSWDRLRWGHVRLGEGHVDNILKLGYEVDCLIVCTFCSFENNIYVCPVIWRTGMIVSGSVYLMLLGLV